MLVDRRRWPANDHALGQGRGANGRSGYQEGNANGEKKTVDTGVVDCTEQKRLNEAREAGIPWKKWGPYLSERQWGTVREDYSPDGNAWDYFTARPVPLAGLPVGRGRPRRDLRRQAAPLLRPRPLERAGPHPQGARVRPHQQRGEPRRGREGVLLLPRLDADPLVHEVPLQVPAARVPLPRPRRDEPAADAGGARVRARGHRDLRRRPVLRRLPRVRKGGPGGHPDPRVGPQPRARRRPGCSSSRRCGSGTPGRGETRETKPVLRETGGAIVASHPELGEYTLSCDGAPELLFTENESNAERLWGQPNPTPYVKDAFHRYVVAGEQDAVNPAKTGTKAAARYVLEVPAGGCEVVRLRLAGHGRARRSARPSRRRSGSGCSTPTSSTSGSRRARWARTSGGSTARRSPGCSGRSSTTTSTWTGG